jgi:hypothetical protein
MLTVPAPAEHVDCGRAVALCDLRVYRWLPSALWARLISGVSRSSSSLVVRAVREAATNRSYRQIPRKPPISGPTMGTHQ